MRQSTTVLSAFWTATLLLSPIAAAAADTRYEAREDAVILAFLKNRLAEAKGHPICFSPKLAAVHPDSVSHIQKLRPEPSTPATRAYARDVVAWKNVPRRILDQTRELSIGSTDWKALHARPATYGECSGTQFGFHRVAIARSTAMIYGYQGRRCISSTIGANIRRINGRWTLIHLKGYYSVVGPPGCGELPISPEQAAMTGYVMISEKP